MAGDRYTTPEWEASALVTIDCQRDVLDGQPLEIPGSSAAVPTIERLLAGFRRAERPIVHLVRLYRADGSNVDLSRRCLVEEGAAILAPDSDGSQLAQELLPDPTVRLQSDLLLAGQVQELGPAEAVMYKPRWGAFFDTALEAHLRAHGVSTVVFCGFNFPNCPRTSVYEASERDFRVVLATDAISGLYERGEHELAAIGVSPMRSDEVVEALPARAAAVP